MHTSTSLRWLVVAISAAMLLVFAAACTETVEVPGETIVVEKVVTETVEVPGETIVVEKVVTETVEVPGETVTKEVVKEVMVPGETVVVKEEVVRTVEVPGETVVKEVVKEVMVPGETVVVEKEVVKTVEVPGETVVVEKEVVKTVEVVKEVPRGPVGDTTKAVGAFATIGSNLDPRADGHKPSGFPIFDPLLHMNQDHQVEPYLAASWEASPTLKQITFHLRDDAKFHTGDAVEARDIIQTIDIYWRDPSQDYARANDYKNNVVRLEAVDNLTLELEMSTPAVDRLEFYTEKDPHHVLNASRIEELGAEDYFQDPINSKLGSGPYIMTDRDPDSFYAYERWDDWWGGTQGWGDGGVHFQYLEIRRVPDPATRIALLAANQADVITMSPILLGTIGRIPGRTVIQSPAGIMTDIVFSGLFREHQPGYRADNPYLDERVRKALNIGIDRDDLNQRVYAGGAIRSDAPLLAPGMLGWDDPVAVAMRNDPIPFDPEEGKRLLAEAGHADTEFNFGLVDGYAGYPENREVGEYLVNELQRNLGLNISAAPLNLGALFGANSRRELYQDTFYMSNGHRKNMNLSFIPRSQWYSPSVPGSPGEDGPLGYGDFLGKEFDDIYQPVFWAETQQEHAMLAALASQYIRQTWLSVPLLVIPLYWGVNSDKISSWHLVPGAPWANGFRTLKPAQ